MSSKRNIVDSRKILPFPASSEGAAKNAEGNGLPAVAASVIQIQEYKNSSNCDYKITQAERQRILKKILKEAESLDW